MYALVVAKGGPKLTPGVLDETSGPSSSGRGLLKTKGENMRGFSDMLSDSLERVVVDKTGLTGVYDFALKWTPDLGDTPPKDNDGPSVFTAIQEQLGLKLEPQKGPVEMFVIDQVQKPSDN